MKVLLTSTSFQDVPGNHHRYLAMQEFDITRMRGPVDANTLVPIIASFDGVICGDDDFNERVLRIGASGRLKYISKYGVGLDQIDLDAAAQYGIAVSNCPDVNSVSVAEHVFALLFSFMRNVPQLIETTRKGGWERLVGNELAGKTIGVYGMGSVGKETAKKAQALGLRVLVADKNLDHAYVRDFGYRVCSTLNEMLQNVDILTLHIPLTPETDKIIDNEKIQKVMRPGTIIINTARGQLVDNDAIMAGIKNGIIKGYLTDVLDAEPMPANHPLQNEPMVFVTPHIGSRTYESVERQGLMAIENLVHMTKGS